MPLNNIFVIMLFSISSLMIAQTTPNTISNGKIQIALQLIPNAVATEDWDGLYSIELTRAIKRNNLPHHISIIFDQHQYRKEQEDKTWGQYGHSIELYNKQTKTGWICKSHPLLKAYSRFTPESAMTANQIEEIDEPQIEYFDETKEIAGYSCQKAIWSTDEESWEVWYVPELKHPTILQDAWGLSNIAGFILEMTENPKANQVSARRYSILSLEEFESTPDDFSIPEGFILYENTAISKMALIDTLRQSFSTNDADIDLFTGPWKLDHFKDEYYLKIEIRDGKRVLIKDLGRGEASVYPISILDNLVLVAQEQEFKIYEVSQSGKRMKELGNTAFEFCKVKMSSLKKAGIDFQ